MGSANLLQSSARSSSCVCRFGGLLINGRIAVTSLDRCWLWGVNSNEAIEEKHKGQPLITQNLERGPEKKKKNHYFQRLWFFFCFVCLLFFRELRQSNSRITAWFYWKLSGTLYFNVWFGFFFGGVFFSLHFNKKMPQCSQKCGQCSWVAGVLSFTVK